MDLVRSTPSIAHSLEEGAHFYVHKAGLSGQLELVTFARHEGPSTTVSLHRENDNGQLPALKAVFVSPPAGCHLPRGLVNRPLCRILNVDPLALHMKEWKEHLIMKVSHLA